jgi:hypothetical protein
MKSNTKKKQEEVKQKIKQINQQPTNISLEAKAQSAGCIHCSSL